MESKAIKKANYTRLEQDEEPISRRMTTPKKSPSFETVLGTSLGLLAIAVLSCFVVIYHRDHATSSNYPENSETMYETNDLPQLSCTSAANHTDSCYVEKPCGLLLLAQMYDPKVGPIDNWMVHGLWGNYCNGSYPQSCDPSRKVHDVAGIMRQHRQNFFLNYMQINWKNSPDITLTNGSSADLWAHEWNKHGTCLSTLRPECYAGPDLEYEDGQEIVDYFTTTIRLHRGLRTFQWLEECGIVPGKDVEYELGQIEMCLTAASGFRPRIGCNNGSHELNEVWYSMHWEGRIRDGTNVGTHSKGDSNCQEGGIRYLPATGSKYD